MLEEWCKLIEKHLHHWHPMAWSPNSVLCWFDIDTFLQSLCSEATIAPMKLTWFRPCRLVCKFLKQNLMYVLKVQEASDSIFFYSWFRGLVCLFQFSYLGLLYIPTHFGSCTCNAYLFSFIWHGILYVFFSLISLMKTVMGSTSSLYPHHCSVEIEESLSGWQVDWDVALSSPNLDKHS